MLLATSYSEIFHSPSTRMIETDVWVPLPLAQCWCNGSPALLTMGVSGDGMAVVNACV